MPVTYSPLLFSILSEQIGYFTPHQELPERVKLDNPAVDVMTDLRQVAAYSVSMGQTIERALERMKNRGVRLLLVTDERGRVYGLITARDIQGEKPVKLGQKMGQEPKDLRVRDLMTLGGKLEVLQFDDVLAAKVGNIVATLRDSGRQHALVVDSDPQRGGNAAVRGIFSLAQIGKQMGLSVESAERATTFADIERELSG